MLATTELKPTGSIVRQLLIMAITLIAIFQAGRSIVGSVQRQVYLHKQSNLLKDGQKQAEDINKELRDGLTSYRSSSGIERLARERLNLAAPDEVIIRIGK
jgi:cell division protein FtsB